MCGPGSRLSRSIPRTPTARRSTQRCHTPGFVCDRFHLVRGANTALDAVRRERQREARRRRPKGARRSGQHVTWRPELYRARHRLLKARERLTSHERRRLAQLFERDPIVAEAWGLKEAFRHIYVACDRTDAELQLDTFLAAVDRADYPHSTRSPKASDNGAPSCWPTSTNRPPTATPKVSSTRSRSSNAAPTAYQPLTASERGYS